MKLKPKPAKAAAKPSIKVASRADQLAETYFKCEESCDEANKNFASIKEIIISAAKSKDAEVEGKTRLLKGQKYQVGFTACMSSPRLDAAVLQKLLSPALRSKVFRKVEVEEFDEAAFIQLVETGKIDAKIVSKATIPSEHKYDKVTVAKIFK